MKNNDFEKLILELENSGASQKEAEELVLLSKNVSNLLKVERSVITKNKFLGQIAGLKTTGNWTFGKWMAVPLIAISLLVFLGSYAVASAQNSLPGEPLYPVKILSENIIAAVNPGFKGVILQRRSEEIEQLSKQNSSQNTKSLQNTINKYENTLNEEGGISARSYEESRKNLEEATKSATPINRKVIENVIMQTDNKQQDILREIKYKKESPSGSPTEGNSGSKPVQEQNSIQNQVENQNNIENPLDR